jgi:hypothetical protein
MFAKAFKIIRAVCWHILKKFAFTASRIADNFSIKWIEMLMFLKSMITETFSLRAYHFALKAFWISPGHI